MRRRSARIPQRRRIFLGCEGESERSYGALLARLTEMRHRRIHLDAVLLQPGAGGPLALLERAISVLGRRSDQKNPYAVRALLLDSDKLGEASVRDAKIDGLARRHAIRLIWQEPCHEALLLRHLDGCDWLRPAECRQAEIELQRRWAGYEKALPAARLAAVIDEGSVLRAAQVEPALSAFLNDIEFARN